MFLFNTDTKLKKGAEMADEMTESIIGGSVVFPFFKNISNVEKRD